MFTHLAIDVADARKIFQEFHPGSKHGLSPWNDYTLEQFLRENRELYVGNVGHLNWDNQTETYELRFNNYLAAVPAFVTSRNIQVRQATLKRYDNAPTKALAGYYRDEQSGCSAVVEHRVKHNKKPFENGKFVHSITVSGPTLEAVNEYNSQLSSGALNEQRVHAFE